MSATAAQSILDLSRSRRRIIMRKRFMSLALAEPVKFGPESASRLRQKTRQLMQERVFKLTLSNESARHQACTQSLILAAS
jgi:hypothetical protein